MELERGSHEDHLHFIVQSCGCRLLMFLTVYCGTAYGHDEGDH